MKIVWSPLAIDRVVDIANWIASDRPNVADRLVDELFQVVERVGDFPQSGRMVPEFRQPNLREIVHREYRIIYRVSKNSVEVLTVRLSLQLLEEEDLGGEPGV